MPWRGNWKNVTWKVSVFLSASWMSFIHPLPSWPWLLDLVDFQQTLRTCVSLSSSYLRWFLFLSTMVQITIKPFIWGIFVLCFPLWIQVPPKKILFSPPNCTLSSAFRAATSLENHRVSTCSKHRNAANLSGFPPRKWGSRQVIRDGQCSQGSCIARRLGVMAPQLLGFGKRCKKRWKLGPKDEQQKENRRCFMYNI